MNKLQHKHTHTHTNTHMQSSNREVNDFIIHSKTNQQKPQKIHHPENITKPYLINKNPKQKTKNNDKSQIRKRERK